MGINHSASSFRRFKGLQCFDCATSLGRGEVQYCFHLQLLIVVSKETMVGRGVGVLCNHLWLSNER